eukprot:2986114-Amphidinium_carterae.1
MKIVIKFIQNDWKIVIGLVSTVYVTTRIGLTRVVGQCILCCRAETATQSELFLVNALPFACSWTADMLGAPYLGRPQRPFRQLRHGAPLPQEKNPMSKEGKTLD